MIKHRRHRRLGLPIWVWVVLAVAGVSIAVIRGTEVLRDHAAANVITLIAVFVAMMTLVVWFAFFSGYARRVRMTTLVGGLVVIAVLAALFRIDHVTGDMVPRFALRFSRPPDELLGKPIPVGRAEDEGTAVDLLATSEDDFPQFLGPGRNLTVDHVKLARDWAARPPQLVWRQEIGAGWSAFAVVGGYAITMEQRGDSELVTCYEVKTGRLRWAHAMRTRYQSKLAGVGPRATPTIDEGLVYALGATGRLVCLDGAAGNCLWQRDLLREYGEITDGEDPQVPYGRANSPLVVDELLVVPAGGPGSGQYPTAPCVSLVAYDKRTGELVWEGGRRQVSYSSPVRAALGGVDQILIVNEDYVSGHDVTTGNVLWEHAWPGKSRTNANVSQAVPLPPDRVFLSKGYSKGAALVQLTPQGDGTFDTEELWHSPRVMRTKFTNVAIRDGHVFGLSDGILECVDLETGRRVWKGGRYGHGQILLVDDLLLLSAESGEVLLIEATPKRRNHVRGRFQAVEGKTWNNMALFGPYLLVRNAEEAACYKLPLWRAKVIAYPDRSGTTYGSR